MLLPSVRFLIACLWVGSLWTVGYLVAPTLFATLADRVLAGTIAGNLFRVEAWLSLFCAVALTGLLFLGAQPDNPASRNSRLLLIAGMAACTLVGYFGLQPLMAALRETAAAAGGVMSAEARTQFGALHGLAMGIYLVQSVLGVRLLLKLR